MTPGPAGNPVESLVPEVKEYATASFCLGEDLDRLHRVRHVGASEAAIFYGARILDVLSCAALQVVELPVSTSIFSNLDALRQYNLVRATTLSWAHALRRLGNRVRHIEGRVRPEDVDLSALFVERWLEWFFCGFRFQPRRLRSLTPDDTPFTLATGADLRPVMQQLEAEDFDPLDFTARADGTRGAAFLRTPALPAVVAEMLLERGHHDEARGVLEQALAEFPDDLRLNQLSGLYWSRTGNLPEALRILEPLYGKHRNDEETAGITAGVYKRRWLANRADQQWLVESHKAYRQAWKSSGKTSAYLGINAATTARWLGRPDQEWRPTAEAVQRLLLRRAAALARHPELVLNYWDQATLAEAELLLGNFDAARHTYQQAFATHPKQRDNIDVTRKQLGELLHTLGRPETAEAFLARPLGPGPG